MQKQTQPQLIVTDKDYERLSSMLEFNDSKNAEKLWDELARAQVVTQNQVPKDVVTMNSVVRIKDVATGEQRELVLVYPNQADAALGKVSILAPVGMAIIGLRVGQSIDWVLPNGKTKRIQVTEVSYQPEAYGVFSL